MNDMTNIDTQTGEVLAVEPRTVPAEIIKARIAVMKAAHGVGKTGKNTFHGYDYASDFDVLSLVQPAMVEHGLALEFWPEEITGPDDNGNMWVRFAMQWQHESGSCSEPVPWYGIAQDRDKQGRMGDKWFNKAATAAEKYFLLKQFHIPASKDVDPDHGAGEGNPAPQNGDKITADQKQYLIGLMQEVGADTAKFLQYLGIKYIDDLPASRVEAATAALEAKRKAAA